MAFLTSFLLLLLLDLFILSCVSSVTFFLLSSNVQTQSLFEELDSVFSRNHALFP